MKELRFLLVLAGLLGALCLSVKAQLPIGVIDQQSMTNNAAQNMINTNRNLILGGNAAMAAGSAEDRRKVAAGAAKIKAGKASLMITPTYAGTVNVVKSISFYPESPQTVPEQVIFVQNYIKRFNQLMTKAGYQVNNMADGLTFSYALAYMAAYNKELKANEISEMRQRISRTWLTRPYFQGEPSVEKQYFYEMWAFMAMQAVDEKTKAKVANTQQEKQLLNERALSHAKYVLDVEL